MCGHVTINAYAFVIFARVIIERQRLQMQNGWFQLWVSRKQWLSVGEAGGSTRPGSDLLNATIECVALCLTGVILGQGRA